MASFQFAPQSLLAPFASLGLVVNLGLARFMHGEKLGMIDFSATGMVVGGVVVCLLNSASDAGLLRTPEELAALAMDSTFLCWAGTLVALLVASAVQALRGEECSIITKVSCSVLPGFAGGCTILCAKILTEATSAGAPFSVLAALGAGAGLCGVSQVTCLNRAVGRYSSLLVVPIFTATSLATNASGGGIFFKEFATFSAEQGATYFGGVVLLLAGVLLLARKASAPESPAVDQPKKKR